jgi:hypothetical protein
MRRDIVTTQRTGKGWKAIQAMGLMAFLIGGAAIYLHGTRGGTPGMQALAWLGFLAGMPTLLVGKLGAWWCHE